MSADNSSDQQLDEFISRIGVSENFTVLPCRAEKFVESSRFFHRFDRHAIDDVLATAKNFGADTMFCLDITCAWAGTYMDVPFKITWLGDLHYQTTWYNALYSWKEGTARPWHLLWAIMQCLSWRRIYSRVLRHYAKVIVSSKSSEPSLARLGIPSRYLPYPWPSGTPRQADGQALASHPSFLFFGSLGALGSRSAFRTLIEGIYPLAVREFGAARFRISICGQGRPSGWASEALESKPEIEFLGFVDDLVALFPAYHALIAPIDVPVGNRSRIITAMANRLPVIAHVNTALGNPDLIDGKTCYLARTPAEFATKMRVIVGNPALADAIKEEARLTYERKFAPPSAVTAFMNETIGTNVL
jgi:glycosyltransferase involved in cell wall biosynthesis